MLYTEEAVRANIRNREGRRVFYLGPGDCLTPGARDFLTRQHIQILSAAEAKPREYRLQGGGYLREKPEHLTHLNGDVLVPKTHPRIAFRGVMDTLQAEIILCQLMVSPELSRRLQELLELSREIIACDVLEKTLHWERLLGLSEEELRSRSHRPQDFYGQPHFMPSATDGAAVVWLNRCRCAFRSAELAACRAFETPEGNSRPDLVQALNRMSSSVYLLMIEEKAKKQGRE
jgi:ethanolamine utilization cobalamin adenosyltransferase